jgi:hypothetical protein
MERRISLRTVSLLFSLICSVADLCAQQPNAAIAVETVELVFDGKPIGQLPAGTAVVIVGEKRDQGLTLVRFTSASGEKVMGLVRTSALIESNQPFDEAGNPESSPTPRPAATPPPVDLEQQLTAAQLAEHLEQNRDKFAELAGKIVKVDGVVEALRVVGKVGSMTTAEVTLKTRPDLPKIRLMIHASEFMEDAEADRFEMRVQGRTLEGRSRDTRSPYKYWYWYNGYWRWRNVAKSEWVPIISVGEPLKGSGVLGKYHINIDLEGAKIDKS